MCAHKGRHRETEAAPSVAAKAGDGQSALVAWRAISLAHRVMSSLDSPTAGPLVVS